MSVTDAEYAMLSNAVYHDENYISPENYGFTRVADKGYDETGFYAEAYKRGNDLVIVFRGTDNSLNIMHDVQWGLSGTLPKEFSSAMAFYNKILEEYGDRRFNISMTGHSLGGSAVQYVNARLTIESGYQVPGVAFAPAGVAKFFPGLDTDSIAVKNYVRDGDMVPGRMDAQLGYETIHLQPTDKSYRVRYNNEGIGEILALPGDGSLIAQHKMLGYWVDVGDLKYRFDEQIFSPVASQSYYFQSPEQQSQDMRNIVYFARMSDDSSEEVEASYDIEVQAGKWSYKTEIEV